MRFKVTFRNAEHEPVFIEADTFHSSGSGDGVIFYTRQPGDPIRDQWGAVVAGPRRSESTSLFNAVLMVEPIEADD